MKTEAQVNFHVLTDPKFGRPTSVEITIECPPGRPVFVGHRQPQGDPVLVSFDSGVSEPTLVRELFVTMATSQQLKPGELLLRAPAMLEAARELARFMFEQGVA